jgi:RNA polymerase sigma factor (TIGR02999 family)
VSNVQLRSAPSAPLSGADAQARLLAQHYADFRALARRVLSGDGARLQIQPTDLAHEAAIRLMRSGHLEVTGRAHFLALSARVMRQTLLDEVRRSRAKKRQLPGVLTLWPEQDGHEPIDIEALDEALTELAEISPDRARIVELRFFAGLTMEEIAVQLKESESTVKRRWRVARAWLVDRLKA